MPAIAIETSGYVLHARAWRETSLLLECFTPGQGRIGLVARGVRGARTRTARADLQPLRRLRLSFVTGGEMGSLRMAELETLHALHGEALLAALYVNELLVRLLARDDAHPRLFGCRVFLKTWVKVRAGWSDDETQLKRLGYTD